MNAGASAPSAAGAGAYGQATGAAPAATSSGMADNVAAALAYLLGPITGIIFLVLAPYNQNRTIRFHAFQSIFFSVGTVIAWIAFLIVSAILTHIPILGFIIDLLLWAALSIGLLIVWLVLMFKAYNNQRLSLPIIGPIAEKQA